MGAFQSSAIIYAIRDSPRARNASVRFIVINLRPELYFWEKPNCLIYRLFLFP